MLNDNTPKIYVACLAAYNSGHLHGKWIDCGNGTDHIWENVHEIIKTSPVSDAEEWAIHDYENFGSISISEFTGIEEVAELAEFISEHGELGAEVLAHAGGIEEAKEMLEERYHGEHKSCEDFAISFIEETTDMKAIPQFLQYHIDWEGVARDLFINDFIEIEVNGFIHVFSNN